MMSNNIILEL